jgi:hypothetical protein
MRRCGYEASAYQFHVAHVLYEFRDLEGSVAAMRESLPLQPKQERQGRVHSNAILAPRQFELGRMDAACATWSAFLDDYARLAGWPAKASSPSPDAACTKSGCNGRSAGWERHGRRPPLSPDQPEYPRVGYLAVHDAVFPQRPFSDTGPRSAASRQHGALVPVPRGARAPLSVQGVPRPGRLSQAAP